MPDDDPFGLRHREQRTVITRPQPGGRRPTGERAPTPSRQSYEAAPGGAVELPPVPGTGALVAAAEPLLVLAAQLRGPEPPRDVSALHARIAGELESFPARVQGGVAAADVDRGRRALAAFIDETVLNTPWGPRSEWPQRRLATVLFGDDDAGRSFFVSLEDAERDALRHRELLELLHACLVLGFEGVYAVQPQRPGSRPLSQIRNDLYRRLRGRDAEPGLSPRWQGFDLPMGAERKLVPNWVAAVAALGVLGLLYIGFAYRLSGYGDDIAALLPAAAPVTLVRIAPVQPPPPALVAARFEPSAQLFLPEERAKGLIDVAEQPDVVLVRIRGDGLFASGSAELTPQFVPLVERIAAALAGRDGRVTVIGHTDNVPIKTARFPSNFELSRSRAEAVAQILAGQLGPDRQLTVEAAADTRPIVENSTPEGRARNRRIEIVLRND